MRVCVFGAGAIGGHLAARLAQAPGATVSVVARGAQLAAIRARGLRVRAADGTIEATVAASDDPSELGPQDVVLVTTKAPALASVAATVAPLLGPDTAVAFVTNGIPWWYFDREGGPHDGTLLAQLDPDGAVRAAIGPERVIGGVIYSSCTVVEPGVVEATNARNRLVLGEPDGRLSERAERLAELLRGKAFEVEVTPRIRDAIWSKLLLNLPAAALGIPATSGTARLLAEPALEAAVRRVVVEGAAIAQALGCRVTSDVERMLDQGRRSTHTSSIVQDLQLGRPMEVAAQLDVPLALARLGGVETPTLDLLVALARVRARGAGLYEG